MALDATIGGANSNSYALVADADAYFLTVLGGAAWAPLAEELKENLLIEATRLWTCTTRGTALESMIFSVLVGRVWVLTTLTTGLSLRTLFLKP